MTDEKTVVVNQGQRTYHTSKGPLHPGSSIEVEGTEAKNLLDNWDVKDARKVIPQTSETIDALKVENARLKAEVERLQRLNPPEPKKGKDSK